VIDFAFWFSFAIFQTTFALFAAERFGFDAARTGYYFAGFGLLGAIIQGGFIRPLVHRFGDKTTFLVGLVMGVIGLVGSGLTHSVGMFALMLVPLAFGMGFGMPTLSSLVSRAAGAHEQGRMQGAASAIESLSRTDGPVWGTALLQNLGATSPFVSAAVFLLLTLLVGLGFQVPEHDPLSVGRLS
jgi:DHA1 family tetracycline resistance protein-like MFS transporter